jgi:hypothetical protein
VIEVAGRCDSVGDLRPDGAFLRLFCVTEDCRHGIVMTEPDALALIAAVATGLNRLQQRQRGGPPLEPR